jgi:hypothetical protein
MLFALGPWSITHRLTVPSIACQVSTPSGLPSGTRCGFWSTHPDSIRSIRFRALAACANFERSGVQLPVVLGRDLRLILMGFGYCVVVQRTQRTRLGRADAVIRQGSANIPASLALLAELLFVVVFIRFLAIHTPAAVAFGVREIDQRSFPFDVSAAEFTCHFRELVGDSKSTTRRGI